MEDELHEVRERFYIGAFPGALEQIQRVSGLNEISEMEKKGIEARSYLSMGKFSKLKDLRESPDPSQRCVASFAMFLKGKEPKKTQAFEGLVS